jgi:putative N6-adenine-specific DNA methylase
VCSAVSTAGDVTPREASPPIAAGDRDAGAVTATRANAERAGVADDIDCQHVALAAHPWWQPDASRPRGVVVTNPPFGRRVRGKNPLLPLYQTLGHRIQKLGDGWRLALLANDVRLARRCGVPLAAGFTTRHGGLSVTALVSTDEGAGERGDVASAR